MKYKVIVVDGSGTSAFNGIAAVSFYTYSQADAYCRQISSTQYASVNFGAYLWTGVDVITYINGSPT